MQERALGKDFFWGNSTSSMQTEGLKTKDGRGASVYDTYRRADGSSVWDLAIDECHRYPEDIQWMKKMGMNFYRFQLSWSRIFPDASGRVNKEGLAFYDRLVDALLQAGIQPMICLYHFDMPLWMAEEKNGFLSREVKDRFVAYGRFAIDHFHDRVKYWISFNEHNLYGQAGAAKIGGSLRAEEEEDVFQIQHHTLTAYAEIANYLHQTYPDLRIGGMLAYTLFYPASSSPEDGWLARQYDHFQNRLFLDIFMGRGYPAYFERYLERKGIQLDRQAADFQALQEVRSDFLSFSYYRSAVLSSAGEKREYDPLARPPFTKNPYVEANEWGWEVDSLGLRALSNDLYSYCRLPLFLIENGIGLKEELPEDGLIQDWSRIQYHRDHIQALKEAVLLDGVDYLGYLGWGLIDIPSSQGNMEKRYGAIYVNRGNEEIRDLRRIPKLSYYWFRQVFLSKGEDLSADPDHLLEMARREGKQ